MSEVAVVQTHLSIRVNATEFIGMRAAIRAAAEQYSKKPVYVQLSITLMDQNDPKFHVVRDTITVAIVDVVRCAEGDEIISVRAKIVNGTRKIATVPVEDGNAIDDVKILEKGDDLTIVMDTLLGDAAIVKNIGLKGMTILENPIKVLPRLKMTASIPMPSDDNATDWDTFSADFDEYDGYDDEEIQGDDESGDGDGDDGDGDGDGSDE